MCFSAWNKWTTKSNSIFSFFRCGKPRLANMQVWQTVFYECKLQPQPRRFASPWNSKIYQHSIQIIQLKIAGDKSWFGDDHTARASNFGRNQYPKLLCPKLSFRTTSHEQNTFTSAKGVILLEIRRMHNAYISEDWAKRYFSKWHILGIHMMVQRCFPPTQRKTHIF